MWVYLLLIAVTLAVYWYGWRPMTFWKKHGIPYIRPFPFVGNFLPVLLRKESMVDAAISVYNAMPERQCYGIYSFAQPSLLIRDPNLIKAMNIKDFENFVDRPITFFREQMFDRSIVMLKGQLWRNMRATLSPAFTGSKMRGMINFMCECGEQLNQHYRSEYAKLNTGKPLDVDLKDLYTRYTNDVIATTAFGIRTDSFSEPNNAFYCMGKNLMQFSMWKLTFVMALPRLAMALGVSVMSPEVMSFFRTLIKDTLEFRTREKIIRPDMLHLLMEAQKGSLNHEEEVQETDRGFAVVQESHIGKSNDKIVLSDADIIAQVFIFFLAGFETASVSMCFASYELAVNPDIQKRLQQEIDDVKANSNEKNFYEKLHKMTYLDMVISETLRKWPPGPQTMRCCTKEYTFEAHGQQIKMEPGMNVMFSVIGLHRDPKYFPNPMKFDPERFSDENKGNIQPFTYLPFGLGPRNCIGSRFALMETKVALFYMLANFDLIVTEKTQIPAKLKIGAPSMVFEKGFWVGLKPRN